MPYDRYDEAGQAYQLSGQACFKASMSGLS